MGIPKLIENSNDTQLKEKNCTRINLECMDSDMDLTLGDAGKEKFS